jgi:hypothetical protein
MVRLTMREYNTPTAINPGCLFRDMTYQQWPQQTVQNSSGHPIVIHSTIS